MKRVGALTRWLSPQIGRLAGPTQRILEPTRKALGRRSVVTTTRVLAGVVGFLLLGTGLAMTIMPELTAALQLALTTGPAGANSLRGDIGGLFLGMGFFTLLGVFTRHRWLLLIPSVFMFLIVAGRSISAVVDPFPMVPRGAFAAELIFFALLFLAIASYASSSDAEEGPPALKAALSPQVLAWVAILAVVAAGAFAFREQIGTRLWNGAVGSAMAQSGIDDLPDGLHVILAGTGSPMPSSRRAGASTAVIAGEHLFIVDSGPGSTLNLELMKVPIEETDAVLLTHFHSDHIAGLGELMLKAWTTGARTEPLPVIGPEGVETVVGGFNQAFSLDSEYRYAHHGDAVAPVKGTGGVARTIDGFGEDSGMVVFQAGDLKVTAFLVDHRPVDPAVGYRFDYRGRSVVISGDALPSESLRHHSQGVDLLVHEALAPEMLGQVNLAASGTGEDVIESVATDILTYHTFPEEAARIARDADVGHLVLHHIIPPLPFSVFNHAFLGDSDKLYSGPITVGSDGMLFSLLPNTTEIGERWLLW